LDDVLGFSKNVGNCKVCEAMSAEARALKKISLLSDNEDSVEEAAAVKKESPVLKPQPSSSAKKPQSTDSDTMKDLFMNMWMNTTFTKPGMFFIGTLLDDDQMLEKTIPTTPAEQVAFTAEMADFFAGKTDIVRTPKEMEQYSKLLKQAVGIEDEEGMDRTGYAPKKKRKKSKHGTTFI